MGPLRRRATVNYPSGALGVLSAADSVLYSYSSAEHHCGSVALFRVLGHNCTRAVDDAVASSPPPPAIRPAARRRRISDATMRAFDRDRCAHAGVKRAQVAQRHATPAVRRGRSSAGCKPRVVRQMRQQSAPRAAPSSSARNRCLSRLKPHGPTLVPEAPPAYITSAGTTRVTAMTDQPEPRDLAHPCRPRHSARWPRPKARAARRRRRQGDARGAWRPRRAGAGALRRLGEEEGIATDFLRGVGEGAGSRQQTRRMTPPCPRPVRLQARHPLPPQVTARSDPPTCPRPGPRMESAATSPLACTSWQL